MPVRPSLVTAVVALASGMNAAAQSPSCAVPHAAGATALDSAIISAMREHGVPGATLAIVRDGSVERLAGFGCANIERDIPVDPRTTVFHVASVSKPFVALAAMQLVERGSVKLDADVNGYVRGVQVPGGWNRPVTLHDLLTHTAGLEESIVGYAARTPADIRPLGEFLATRLPRRGWPPGEVTAYSNYGYALAGYLVESVSGVSFADYARNEVLAPLGMTRSSFTQPTPAELEPFSATAYSCSADACEPQLRDYRSAYPPGGLVTTAEDMSRFMLAQLGVPLDGRRVLSDSVLALMHTRQFALDPALPGLTYGFAEDRLVGDRALTHAGGASGFTSFVVLVPGRQFGAFVAANGGSSRFGSAALDAVRRASFPDRAAAPSDAPPDAPVEAAVDPSGSYRLTRYAHRGVENLAALFAGQLHVTRLSGDTIDVAGLGDANGSYFPIGDNRWRKVGGNDLVAVRTRDGKVTHLFGSQSFFGTRFPSAYEKLAWYDAPRFMNEALSYTLGIPILALLIWPVAAGVVWLIRRWRGVTDRRRVPRHSGRNAAVAASVAYTALAAWFGFGFIAATNRAAERGGGELVYGLPTTMRILAWAPGVLAALTAVMVVAAVVGWRRRWWSVPGRLIYVVIAANAVVFVAILVRWGYFPIATG